MFTWLQNIMQKHHKWLFSILLVVIIVAFVFTIGNTGGIGSGARGDFRVDFYGFDLNSQQEMETLSTWTAVSLELHGQRAGGEEMQAAMLQRAVLLHLANQLGVPEPSDQKLALFVRRLPAFQDPESGRFSNEHYTQMLDNYATIPQIGEETVTLVILQDYRIEQVRNNLQGPGYTLAGQAKLELQGRNTEWSVELASLEPGSFTFEIEPDEAALRKFYQENDFRFETAPTLTVSFVEFSAGDYLETVEEPTLEQLEKHYNSHRDRWPQQEDGDNGTPLPLEQVAEAVAASWKNEQARTKAIEAANHFSVDVYEAHYAGDLERDAASIRAFLEGQGLSAQNIPPFPRNKLPTDAGLPRRALQQATGLSERRFFSDGVVTPGGAVVLFFEDEQPAYIPPFEEVRDQVERDFRQVEQQRLYSEKAAETRETLQNAVNEGDSFRETAEALGMSVQSLEPFTFMAPPHNLDYFVMSTLQNLEAGKVSDLLRGGEWDTFVYLESKIIPDYTADAEEVRETLVQLRSFSSRATGQSLINELIRVGQRDLERREF